MKYRADIDGLRAVSVTSVILFHAPFPVFSGGFVGVDIFFVISGYLITTILIDQIKNGHTGWSLIADFYERRARRLFPSLAVVISATFLFFYFYSSPEDFKAFSKSLIAQLVFLSNWLFLSEEGYFAAPSLTKPLLHTWSLAVEEQFYLLFPAALILMSSMKNRNFIFILIIIFVFSLSLSEHFLLKPNANSAFFNSFARFWELMVGVLLAVGQIQNSNWPRPVDTAMRVVGFGLITYSIFMFSRNTPFPGLNALPPTLGAGLIIAANPRNKDVVSRILSTKIMVYIGLISYSLYLWHWPVFVAANMFFHEATNWTKLACIGIAGSFASASYHFLETPVRRHQFLPKRTHVFGALAGVAVIVLVTGVIGYRTNGIPQRLDESYNLANQGKFDHNPDRRYCYTQKSPQIEADEVCVFGPGNRNSIDFIIMGDSHSDAWMPAFRRMSDKYGVKGAYFGLGGCPAIIDLDRLGSKSCSTFMKAGLAFAKRHGVQDVFLVSRWALYPQGWPLDSVESRNGHVDPLIQRTGDNLKTQSAEEAKKVFRQAVMSMPAQVPGMRLYIVGQIPEQPQWVPAVLASDILFGRDSSNIWTTRNSYLERQKFIMDLFKHANFEYIDVTNRFCPEIICLVQEGGKSFYLDDDHLSATGALYASNALDDSFKELASKLNVSPPSEAEAENQRKFYKITSDYQNSVLQVNRLRISQAYYLSVLNIAKSTRSSALLKHATLKLNLGGWNESLKEYRRLRLIFESYIPYSKILYPTKSVHIAPKKNEALNPEDL